MPFRRIYDNRWANQASSILHGTEATLAGITSAVDEIYLEPMQLSTFRRRDIHGVFQ